MDEAGATASRTIGRYQDADAKSDCEVDGALPSRGGAKEDLSMDPARLEPQAALCLAEQHPQFLNWQENWPLKAAEDGYLLLPSNWSDYIKPTEEFVRGGQKTRAPYGVAA